MTHAIAAQPEGARITKSSSPSCTPSSSNRAPRGSCWGGCMRATRHVSPWDGRGRYFASLRVAISSPGVELDATSTSTRSERPCNLQATSISLFAALTSKPVFRRIHRLSMPRPTGTWLRGRGSLLPTRRSSPGRSVALRGGCCLKPRGGRGCGVSEKLGRCGGRTGRCQGAVRAVWSLRRLWVAVMRRHSDRQAALPRRKKRSMRRLNLVLAKIGSIIPWRLP
jgi:hypothetical protein